MNPMNDDTKLAERYVSDTKEAMNLWGNKMHDLYLKITFLLITLSVAAIGFAASHMLEYGYHSGRYETTWACVSLALLCLCAGVILLIYSCFCGLVHLWKNLGFFQENVEFFARHNKIANAKFHGEETDINPEENPTDGNDENPGKWWTRQIKWFGFGMLSLVFWVAFDFFIIK